MVTAAFVAVLVAAAPQAMAIGINKPCIEPDANPIAQSIRGLVHADLPFLAEPEQCTEDGIIQPEGDGETF